MTDIVSDSLLNGVVEERRLLNVRNFLGNATNDLNHHGMWMVGKPRQENEFQV